MIGVARAIRRKCAGTRPVCRGQSEVIGVVLLTGIMVITVGLVGAFVLANVDDRPGPTADFVVTVESSSLEVAHDGGTPLALEDVEVVLDGETRIPLEDFTELQGNGNARFDPGEIREHGHSAAETIRVAVVHEPSNTVLHRDAFDIP